MRVARLKSTGRIIEAQTNDEASLDVLITNAENAGFALTDVETAIIPDSEFNSLLSAQIESEKTYADKRRAEYPSTGDQLDAIWKALSELELPTEAAQMLSAINATKAKFPK